MHCTAQLFVDAMATRRHIRRTHGTKPVTMQEASAELQVTDHHINRMYFVGATGNMQEGIVMFLDGSRAERDEENIWTVTKKAEVVGEIPADFPNPPGAISA